MWYFILAIIILLFLYNYQKKPTKLKGIKYSSVLWGILIIFATFKSYRVGADTPSYIRDYELMKTFTFQEIFERYKGYSLYYIVSKVFTLLNLPVQLWFGFVELLYIIALRKFVNRFSTNQLFSILIYVSIGLFTFSLTGMKQTMAMSFMMLAFLLFVDKKYILTGLFIAACYFCHQASLIFLAAFVLYYVKDMKFFIPLILVSVVFIFFESSLIATTMVSTLQNDHFEMYLENDSSYTYVTFIFYATVILLSLLGYRDYKVAQPETAKYVLGLSMVGCGLQLLASLNPTLFRLAYLYTPFMMILLPNSVTYMKSKEKGIVYMALIFCVSFYFVYTNRTMPYYFMWQD